MVAPTRLHFSLWEWMTLLFHLLPLTVSSSHHHLPGNAANDIVEIVNKNRTSAKLGKLNDSPGLGCMALQYAQLCEGNCTSPGGAMHCKPPEDDFTEVFAPNCGVELPTFGTITGHIVGCGSKYVEPEAAFSQVLVTDGETLSVLRNKSHMEVGVGLVGLHRHKGPFVWCILFSDGRTNSTFVLEDRGLGIQQKKGCFSGSSFPCSGSGIRRIPNAAGMILPLLFLILHILCF